MFRVHRELRTTTRLATTSVGTTRYGWPPLSGYIFTVAEIEKRLGGEFCFFPLAPEEVKDSFNISDWPGLSEIAGSSR